MRRPVQTAPGWFAAWGVVLLLGCRAPNPAFSPASDAAMAADSAVSMSPEAADGAGPILDVRNDLAAAPDGSPQEVGAEGPRSALLIVHDPGQLIPSDTQLVNLLRALGFTVVPRAGRTVSAADATNVSLLVVAPSTETSEYQGRLRDLAIPTIVAESFMFDDMGMTGSVRDVDFGITAGQDVVITRPDHPLAGGQAGRLTVLSDVAGRAGWGVPSAGAIVVAQDPDRADRATLFGYEAGAPMVVGAAPARRVGLFAGDILRTPFTPVGLELVRAAVAWATARP